MRGKRILFLILSVIAFVAVVGISTESQYYEIKANPDLDLIAGRNVNMVSGMTLPDGDPYLQRQNEPSIAVSTRNPLHLLAGANDYRTVDMPFSEGELPGQMQNQATGDAWLGIFKSYDGGQSWISTLLPNYPQDPNTGPLSGYEAAADPVVRAGANGLFYYSGIVFDRTETANNAVFVARFIDNNNDEEGDSIQYIDTKIVDEMNGGRFKDKPWIAVSIPKKNAKTINVDGQNIPRSNVYIVYSVFEETEGILKSKIIFRRSTDCGTTWENPIELSQGHHLNQGATIAVDPRDNGHIYVAWRRFDSGAGQTAQSDAILIARSTNEGKEFPNIIEVTNVPGPFDQPTSSAGVPLAGTAFRTNSYPTMAIDSRGRIYLAWSQRGMDPVYPNDSRVVIATSKDGFVWTTPMTVENAILSANDLDCHEFMPSIAFAGGRLILAWYDTRNDYCPDPPSQWICDSGTVRHTVDVRVAQGQPGEFPVFQPSVQVSRYLWAMWESSPGNYYFSQVQFNPENYPLFKGGTVPFHGDYIDIASSPSIVLSSKGVWRFNTEPNDSQQFHLAWTDNRDVRPPIDNNWEIYNPPSSAQTLSQSQFFVSTDCSDARNTGARNQNIYTSCITSVFEAGTPGNNKPLGTLGDNPATGEMIPRAFVIFVKNPTEDIRHYRLQIADGPDHGTASFLEFDMLEEIDVSIAPYSSISRPLFVTSSDENDNVTVEVFEIDEPGGSPVTGGARSTIVINPDDTAPGVTGDLQKTESHDPDIANPNIVNWTYVNPNIVNPNIVNPNIVNPNIVNPNIVNPNIVNDPLNPNIVNPNIVNTNIVNPNIVNPNIVNPNIVNPNIVNAGIEDIADADVTDIEWAVTNAGNTVSSYTFKIFARESLPKGIYAQLLVYKVHYTPATDGESCELQQTPHHELLLNIVNPNIVNPNIVNPNIVNPNIVNSAIENATFFLSPGDEAKAVLRLIDPEPGVNKFLQSGRKFKIQSFAESLGAATGSQAVDSDDALQGDTTGEADSTELIIITSSLPDGTVGESYPTIQLEAAGGDGTYVWSANSELLPPGIGFTNDGVINGIPQDDPNVTHPHIYSFLVQVSSGGEVDTQNLSITINSAEEPTPPLNIVTTTLPPGTVGNYYGFTLQATGGTPPRSWSLASGTLPLGLTLDSSGVISGTIAEGANVSDPYTFDVQVTDANEDTDIQSLSISVSDIVNPDLTISGRIKNQWGTTVSGVSIYGLPHAPQTDSYGNFSDMVPYGWSGTITPFKAGYAFYVSAQDPSSSRTYDQITEDQYSQDFVADTINYTISGIVTFYGSPLAGVMMNGLPETPVTDANGYYSASVPHGWSGTATPELLDYIFEPPSRSYTSITSDHVNQFYTATFIGVGQDDPFEDNDDFASATDIVAGAYTNLQLFDDDWYRVDVAQDSDLKIVLDGEHINNIDVEILNNAGNRIIGAYGDPEDETVYVSGLDAGWHYIRVIYLGTSGFWNSYDLTLTVGNDLGNGEINGNVLNSTDDALADVEVTAYDAQSDHYFATTSDVNGVYRISLPPSLYKIFFDAGTIGPPSYVSEYYDNKLTFENADTIDVQPGWLILDKDAVLELESVLSVVTSALPEGIIASSYSAQLEATGGVTPYTWDLADESDPLPDGLTLHSNGVIDGTPTTAGTFGFTVEVTDSTSPTPQIATMSLDITISVYGGTDYVISGTVTPPLLGVVMSGFPGNPVTNSSGEYTAYVYSGWSGTVTPIFAGYIFDPASRTYSDVTGNILGENYTASTGRIISGQVTMGGSPLGGVLMGGLPGDPITNENGEYFGTVPSGWSGTVTPTLPGFTFNPTNVPYTNVTTNQSNQDYVANFAGGEDDGYEENDDYASAAEVTLGTHMNLVLADADWFKVFIPSGLEGKDLKINIKGHSYPDPSGGGDMDFMVVDESKKMLGYVLSSSDDETLYISDVTEGWYYIGQTYIGQPGTVYSLTLELSDNFGIGYISGRITDEITGQPIEGIYVELYGQPFDWGNSRPLITTDANGEYKVGYTPGDYTVMFNLQSMGPDPYAQERNYIGETYNSNEILSIAAGTTITGIDDQLRPGGTITGRITDPDGNGIYGFVYVYSSNNTRVSFSRTDANGHYSAERIPTGNYKVRARATYPYKDTQLGVKWYEDRGSFADGYPVPVQAGSITSEINAQLEESGYIEGRVTDSFGDPIQGVSVAAYDAAGIFLVSGGTDEDGNYRIWGRLPSGDVKIYFNASNAQGNYASEYHTDKLLIEDADSVSVQAGQTTYEIDAVLSEGGTISGRVTDAQDDGFPGVAVHCMDIDSDRFYYATTDADGYYTITGLLPDDYKVRFRTTYDEYATQWYNGGFSFADGSTVSVAAGANVPNIKAQLTNNGGFISGRVTNTSDIGIKDVRVYAQDNTKEGAIAWTDTDANGYYTIPRIPTCNAKVYFNTNRQYLNHVAEWYNDANSHASAGTVAVTFGQETTGVNAVLAPISPFNITTTLLPNGEVAVPYEIALEATGGREFYHWSLISGSLPPGLMLNSKGEITGTPTAADLDPYSFTVRVTDSSRNQLIDTQSLNITIGAYAGSGYLISGLIQIDSSPLGGVVLQGLPGNPVTSPNGEYIVAVPQGWSGTVTPTHSGYFFDPQNREYTDVDSSMSGQDYTAYELTLQITTEWLLNGTEGYPYNQSLSAEGGTETYSWSITSGNLPYGLTLDSNGTISGIPTHSDNYDFTVRVTDSSSPIPQLVDKALSISVHGDPTSEGPILYWKLDEGDGTIALDSSGHNENGILHGSVNYTSDSVSGHAAEILANGWLERSHQGPFHFVNQATIMARVKIDDFNQEDRFVWKLQYDEPYRGFPYELEIRMDINGNMLHLDSGNGLIEDIYNCPRFQIGIDLTSTGFALGQYNQIAVTINGDVYKVFINGSEVASATGAPFEVNDSVQNFWVGGANWSEYWLGGKIDEIMVFNMAYGPQEINDIYSMGVLPTISGTVLLSDASPLPWVRMNGLAGDPHVQEDGTYIGVVSPNWSGTVTPDMGGYYFNPPSRTYNIGTSNITGQDYTAYEQGALWIETDWLPDGSKNQSYNTTLVAADGVEPYTWSIVSGSIPAGLTLNPAGVISGTPHEAGDFSFRVRVLDSDSPPRAAEQDLALFISAAHQGFWTTTYPSGGDIYREGLEYNPSNSDEIFATAGGRGIFKSVDAGANWTNLIDDPDWPFGESDYPIFWIHPGVGNYYMSTWGFLYMSDDRGYSWQQIYARDNWDMISFAADPWGPDVDVIYVGTQEEGIFKTTDGGQTWAASSTGLPSDEIRVIAIDPNSHSDVYAGTGNNGLFKSIDFGASWAVVNNGIDFQWISDIVIPDDSNVYVAGRDSLNGEGLFRSTDYGDTWEKLPVEAGVDWNAGNFIAVNWPDTQNIYFASYQSVFKSTDGGANWTEYSVTSSSITSLILHRHHPQILYAGTQGEGVFKSENGGESWTRVSNGINALHFVGDSPHGLEIDKSDPNYIYAGSINGGYRSTNGGSSWEKMNHPAGSILSILTHLGAPGVVYSFHNSLEISNNYGQSGTWQMPTGFPCCFPRGDIGIAADDPGLIYVGTRGSDGPPDGPSNGVYKTTDGGVTFNLMNNGLTTNTEIQSVAVHPGIEPGDHDIVFIGLRRDWPLEQGKDYGLYKTIDGGASWDKITCGLPDDFFTPQIVFSPSNPNIMFMLGETEHECGFYESTDGGDCWTKISDYCGNSIAVDPSNSDLVYMGAWHGFCVSLNGGADWMEFNDGLPRNPGIDAIAIDPNDPQHVFIGTAAGVYEATFSFDFEITTENLPVGIVGEPYIAIIDARGGTYPISWEIVSGELPVGFTFNETETTAEIEGMSLEPGYWEITIKATDNVGNSYTKQYELNIYNTYVLTVNNNNPAGGSVSIDPDQEKYIEGSMVDVSVTITPGYVFTGWSGDATGRATLVHVEMTRDKILTANFATPGSLPDYDISSFNAPGSASAGDTIGSSVSAEVRNQGVAPLDETYIFVGIYLSTDSVISTSDIPLWKGRSDISSMIFVGATTNVPISPDLQIPTTVSAGDYYIGVLADESDLIVEQNENNNFASQAITITSTAYDRLEFLGQWHGGESNAVACDAARNLAFVGHGALFQVLDVSDPSHPTKIGEVALGTRGISDITISGTTAYVAGDGFRIVDVSFPDSPSEIGYSDIPNLARGIVVSGSYAYVTDHFFQGLRVFDITNPSNLNQVSFTSFPGRTRGIAIKGNYLYLQAGSWQEEGETGIRIVDISNPSSPSQENFYATEGGTGWPEVAGDYLLLPTGGEGLHILNISDPLNLPDAIVYGGLGNSGWISTNGDYAYVNDSDRNAILVLNIADVNNVYEEGVYHFEDQTAINFMDVLGNHCYADGWYHSLKILDMSNPSNPTKIGFYDGIEGMLSDVDASGDFAFITSQNQKGVHKFRTLNMSSFPNIAGVGTFVNPSNMFRVGISGNFAFVVTSDQELKVLDISDLSNPHEVAIYENFDSINDLEISGNYAYVLDNFRGLQVIDISAPANPVFVSQWYTHPRSISLAISGNYAYVSALWAGVRIIDISDPMNPWEVGYYQAEDLRAYELAVSGNYAYVADVDDNLRIIDVSDPQNPIEVGSFVTNTLYIEDIEVSGHIVFTGSYINGMMVIDVSDPTNPVKLDELATFSTRAIAIKENRIYELDRGAGLIVYEFRRQ